MKPKKKKKADKKTLEQRMSVLDDCDKFAVLESAMSGCDPNTFNGLKCCQGLTWVECASFWPPLYKDDKTKE